MRAVSEFFLRAKHWQIFLMLVGLSFAGVGAILFTMVSSPQEALKRLFPFFAVMEIFAICFALWLWSLGVFLNFVVPLHLRMKLTLFRLSVIYLPLYVPIFGVFFQSQNLAPVVVIALYAFIFPLHLFGMFCQVYNMYFVSKSLAMAEVSRLASFPDYVGYFFGLWLFPIGVWIIQPRINRLYAKPAPALSS